MPSIWSGERMRATGQWIARATRDERLLAAELVLLAAAGEGLDLVNLALAVGLDVEWGEKDESLRARVAWRGRNYYRVVLHSEQPAPRYAWWARIVRALPRRFRPAARRAVDELRAL